MTLRLMMLPILLLAGCGGEPAPPHAAPVKVEAVAHESDLLRLTLTPEAQARLGIATVRIGAGSAAAIRETSGEIVVPAGAGGVPTNSVSNLAQLGTQQVAADGEIARTQAQVRLARIALGRATALVREETGSVRARATKPPPRAGHRAGRGRCGGRAAAASGSIPPTPTAS